MTVWKFPFDLLAAALGVDIEMPAGARVLFTRMQHGQPCIWAAVDPTAEKETRRFFIVGTGHSFPDGLNHRNCTFHGHLWLNDGEFVFHLFESGRIHVRKLTQAMS
jgi:hypothetical protein